MAKRVNSGGALSLHIELLGTFRVSAGSHAISDAAWRGQARSLVSLLALTPEHRLHREQIVEWLWPDRRPANGANSLHQAIYAARRILEPSLAQAAASAYLHVHHDTVTLAPPGGLWVDVEAFAATAATARRARSSTAYQAALDLYAGDLLPADPYADWAINRREELRALYLALLAEQAQLYEQEGNVDGAIRTLSRLLDVEATDEGAHVELMRLYARTGQRARAVRQYRRLEGALRHEFGTTPGVESRRLLRELADRRPSSGSAATQAGAAGVPSAGAPRDSGGQSRTAPLAWPTTLPVPPTGFVGREHELAGVVRLLASSRLLTLAGAGGCGKTRLALQAAAIVHQAHADGVRLVELASVADQALVAPTVAAALGLREEGRNAADRTLQDTIVETLRPKQMLVILDNCEHLLDACAGLAAALVRDCPRLSVLATSREPLGAEGEVTWQVPGMARPTADDRLPADQLLRYDAVRLFLERAQARRPGFALTHESAAGVAHICRTLEGMPLAIELAAARANILSIDEIAVRLDDSLTLLAHPDRSALPQHRTLRAAIAWSHDLLSEQERSLFRRLSTFAGGWTADAAETVCHGDGIDARSVLDLLALLVERSLVVAEERAGQTRFRMLDPIRQYGAEQLAGAGEGERLRERHGAWCVALAEAAQPELIGAGQTAWLARLVQEHDNLRAALRAAIGAHDAETALRLGAALWRFWFQHGHLREGQTWLEQALAFDWGGDAVAPLLRARALSALGSLVWPQGEYARARALFEESLALRRPLDDPQGVAGCLNNLGNVAQYQGDYAQATIYHGESLALSRQLGDTWAIAGSLTNLAIVQAEQGHYARAIALLEESLALRRQLGDLVSIALTLGNLGVLARYQGEYARAEALLEESLELRRRMDDRWGAGSALANLGSVASDRGDYHRAARRFAESLTLCRETGDQRVTAYCLEGCAAVAVAQDQPRRGVRLAAAAAALREATGAFLPPNERATIDRATATARQALGEEAFAAAWTAGRALPLDEAVAYALSAEAPVQPAAIMPSRPPAAGHTPAPLTAREREVTALIAEGRTNRQIAEALRLAEPTVAKHVGNILAKLGVAAREQVAAWYRAGR